jgi:hypothetical protein
LFWGQIQHFPPEWGGLYLKSMTRIMQKSRAVRTVFPVAAIRNAERLPALNEICSLKTFWKRCAVDDVLGTMCKLGAF